MLSMDEQLARWHAHRHGLDVIETRRNALDRSTGIRFRMLKVIDDYIAAVPDNVMESTPSVEQALNAVCVKVRRRMRSDTLRALLDDGEAIDLLRDGMTPDDASEICERMSVRLAEMSIRYRDGKTEAGEPVAKRVDPPLKYSRHNAMVAARDDATGPIIIWKVRGDQITIERGDVEDLAKCLADVGVVAAVTPSTEPSRAFALEAFMEGFAQSGEGYNGEYSRDPVEPRLGEAFREWYRTAKERANTP